MNFDWRSERCTAHSVNYTPTDNVRPAQPAKPAPSGPVIKDVEFEIGNNPVKGGASAGLILVEFTDYECPFCGRYVRETFPQILNQYIDKGAIQGAMPFASFQIELDAALAAQ